MKYKIFISYSMGDNWTARRISENLIKRGAKVFLDTLETEFGEDFEQKILDNLLDCNELWVLVSQTVQVMKLNQEISNIIYGSLNRPYVLMETGTAWCRNIPIVPILTNISLTSFREDKDIPLILKKNQGIELSNDQQYKELLERTRKKIKNVNNYKERCERYKYRWPISISCSNAKLLKNKKAFITEMSSDGRGCFISTEFLFEANQDIDVQCAFKAQIKHNRQPKPLEYNGQGIGVKIHRNG